MEYSAKNRTTVSQLLKSVYGVTHFTNGPFFRVQGRGIDYVGHEDELGTSQSVFEDNLISRKFTTYLASPPSQRTNPALSYHQRLDFCRHLLGNTDGYTDEQIFLAGEQKMISNRRLVADKLSFAEAVATDNCDHVQLGEATHIHELAYIKSRLGAAYSDAFYSKTTLVYCHSLAYDFDWVIERVMGLEPLAEKIVEQKIEEASTSSLPSIAVTNSREAVQQFRLRNTTVCSLLRTKQPEKHRELYWPCSDPDYSATHRGKISRCLPKNSQFIPLSQFFSEFYAAAAGRFFSDELHVQWLELVNVLWSSGPQFEFSGDNIRRSTKDVKNFTQ